MQTLGNLKTLIGREIANQTLLGLIRGFNHSMVGELAKACSLSGRAFLDVGASVHGYALEAALERGVALYEGIDLGVSRHWRSPIVEFVSPAGSRGRLRQMNAEKLEFPDESFDCLLSISTFEHFLQPAAVLQEMHRVLRPGSVALISFEPIWTASYGHHLHHFGAVSDLVPLWGHLFLSEEQMRQVLGRQPWPSDAPINIENALRWIYRGGDINRFDIQALRIFFEESPFEIAWYQPLRDEISPERCGIAAYVSQLVPYAEDELLTKGLSFLLRKH
jgi:SAM-dependent methyltransferase